jgi:molybdopterin-guanine dinucleotide biosynthesis protein A
LIVFVDVFVIVLVGGEGRRMQGTEWMEGMKRKEK